MVAPSVLHSIFTILFSFSLMEGVSTDGISTSAVVIVSLSKQNWPAEFVAVPNSFFAPTVNVILSISPLQSIVAAPFDWVAIVPSSTAIAAVCFFPCVESLKLMAVMLSPAGAVSIRVLLA